MGTHRENRGGGGYREESGCRLTHCETIKWNERVWRCWKMVIYLESLPALSLQKSSPWNQIFIEGNCVKLLCNWYIAKGQTPPPQKCRFVCMRALCAWPPVCFLTLLIWTEDSCLQAEPEDKKNRLGRPWVGHLFLWMWSVWIRPVCLSHTHRYTIPTSF